MTLVFVEWRDAWEQPQVAAADVSLADTEYRWHTVGVKVAEDAAGLMVASDYDLTEKEWRHVTYIPSTLICRRCEFEVREP